MSPASRFKSEAIVGARWATGACRVSSSSKVDSSKQLCVRWLWFQETDNQSGMLHINLMWFFSFKKSCVFLLIIAKNLTRSLRLTLFCLFFLYLSYIDRCKHLAYQRMKPCNSNVKEEAHQMEYVSFSCVVLLIFTTAEDYPKHWLCCYISSRSHCFLAEGIVCSEAKMFYL